MQTFGLERLIDYLCRIKNHTEMKKAAFFLLIIYTLLSGALRAQNQTDLSEILNQISADSVYATVQDLQNFGSRLAVQNENNPDGNRDVADYIIQRLERYGVTAELDSFPGFNGIDQLFYNVKGVLPSDNPIDDSIVLVGAHMDAIAFNNGNYYSVAAQVPGADDNASGVAVMLELARIIHESNLQFRRYIHFMAFDAEEYGLWGSNYDAHKRSFTGENIALMMNNDMVSNQPEDENWKLSFRWYDNAVDVANRAATICEQYTDLEPVILPETENWELATRSDSYSYYQVGYRAIFAHEYTFSSSYHTPQDVTDSCNYPYLAEVARYNMAMLTAYADPTSGVGIKEHPAVTTTHVYPNPTSGTITLQFQLDQDSPVNVSVLDLSGRTLLRYDNGIQSAGICHSELDLSVLSAGLYLCLIRTDKGVETLKVLRR